MACRFSTGGLLASCGAGAGAGALLAMARGWEGGGECSGGCGGWWMVYGGCWVLGVGR